jgi:hypothetical protein
MVYDSTKIHAMLRNERDFALVSQVEVYASSNSKARPDGNIKEKEKPTTGSIWEPFHKSIENASLGRLMYRFLGDWRSAASWRMQRYTYTPFQGDHQFMERCYLTIVGPYKPSSTAEVCVYSLNVSTH